MLIHKEELYSKLALVEHLCKCTVHYQRLQNIFGTPPAAPPPPRRPAPPPPPPAPSSHMANTCVGPYRCTQGDAPGDPCLPPAAPHDGDGGETKTPAPTLGHKTPGGQAVSPPTPVSSPGVGGGRGLAIAGGSPAAEQRSPSVGQVKTIRMCARTRWRGQGAGLTGDRRDRRAAPKHN